MGEAARKRITVDEFLLWDGEGDTRYQLIGGEIVAMTPLYPQHGAIIANCASLLKQKLKSPCQPVSEAGIRLPWRNDAYYQADIAVTCTRLTRNDWAVPDPVVVVEVISPSTEKEDRIIKLVDYRHIASVQAIILVSSQEKRVELWRRSPGAWTVVDLEPGDSITLDVLGFDIPVEALYDGLEFSEAAVAQG